MKREKKRRLNPVIKARNRLAQNFGRDAELLFEMTQKVQGKKIKRTGRGEDFKVGSTHYEIKTGKAKLTKLQKKTKKKKGGRYKVIHFGLNF